VSFLRFGWQLVSTMRSTRQFPHNGMILLLAVPCAFTIYSLYTGNIQIYPVSAISLLNVRYGLTIMLALAVVPALAWARVGKVVYLLLFALMLCQYGWMWADGARQLAVFQEPYRNNNTREAMARAKLAAYLREHPAAGKVIICTGELFPVVAAGG